MTWGAVGAGVVKTKLLKLLVFESGRTHWPPWSSSSPGQRQSFIGFVQRDPPPHCSPLAQEPPGLTEIGKSQVQEIQKYCVLRNYSNSKEKHSLMID